MVWGWGMWPLDGDPGSGASWGRAGRVAKSDTVKKVYKLYCSTHSHAHIRTHAHPWIGRAPGHRVDRNWGRGWQLETWLLPQPPHHHLGIGEALD